MKNFLVVTSVLVGDFSFSMLFNPVYQNIIIWTCSQYKIIIEVFNFFFD